jgi:hypothetical protein
MTSDRELEAALDRLLDDLDRDAREILELARSLVRVGLRSNDTKTRLAVIEALPEMSDDLKAAAAHPSADSPIE